MRATCGRSHRPAHRGSLELATTYPNGFLEESPLAPDPGGTGHRPCDVARVLDRSPWRSAMPAPASLRPSPRGAPRWHKLVVVAVLLAAAGCSGAADTPSSPRSTRPPPTPTGTTVPALDRGR